MCQKLCQECEGNGSAFPKPANAACAGISAAQPDAALPQILLALMGVAHPCADRRHRVVR